MHSLPSLTNFEAFQAWRADGSQCLSAALDIARSHGLSHADPRLFSTGTNLVVGLDDRLILKIFPPFLRSQFVSERISLAQLRGRLSVPVPEIVLEGERDQWPYLVITRLPGMIGKEAWPALPENQKERVLARIGETIAEVQRVPVGDLSGIEPRWRQFMSKQIEGCRARHERLGLPQKYLDGLDELLRDAAALIPLPERLHDRRDAAPRPKPVRRVRLFERGHEFHHEAPADGAASASSLQRSQQAHLHRGLATEGR